jgi:hypothetical protein
MAERLLPLPVTQMARVRSPVPARPSISVVKLARFYKPASGNTLQAMQLHCIVGIKKIAEAQSKVFPQLEAWVQRT